MQLNSNVLTRPGADKDQVVVVGATAGTLLAKGLLHIDVRSNILTLQPLTGALHVTLSKTSPAPTSSTGFTIANNATAQFSADEVAEAQFISADASSSYNVWCSWGRYREFPTVG